MSSKLNPYISFNGQAHEAMEFYKSVFGGTMELTTYKDGGMSQNQDDAEHIMHGLLVAENGMSLMGSDTPDVNSYNESTRVSISLSGDNEAELSGYYNKLVEGGNVVEPLVKAPWGDMFGMLTDKFGIFWMVNITADKPA